MAGQVTFSLDDTEFREAMLEYIQVSSKDGAFAMNRTMNNLGIFGFHQAKVAQDAEIMRVETLEWWPRYVAKTLANKYPAKAVIKNEVKVNKDKSGFKVYKRVYMRHYTREKARKASASIIRKRSLAVGFVRFFFATLSRSMRAVTPGLKTPPSKTFRGFEVTVKSATMQDPSVTARVEYSYRSRGEVAVKKAEALLRDILDAARPLLIADMREYINRKAASAAKRFSAV